MPGNSDRFSEMSDSKETEATSKTDPKFLEFLVCPVTKTSLDYNEEKQELISWTANLAYPIRDGIPIMLVDEARKLDEDEVRP